MKRENMAIIKKLLFDGLFKGKCRNCGLNGDKAKELKGGI
jgi:hypothetical protein